MNEDIPEAIPGSPYVHDYVLIPQDGGMQIRRRVVTPAQVSRKSVVVVTAAAIEPNAVYEMSGANLWPRWRPGWGGPAVLTIARRNPVEKLCRSVMIAPHLACLIHDDRPDDVPEVNLARQRLRSELSELPCRGEWITAITEFPACVTEIYPVLDAELQAQASDLVRCWAMVWVLMGRSEWRPFR